MSNTVFHTGEEAYFVLPGWFGDLFLARVVVHSMGKAGRVDMVTFDVVEILVGDPQDFKIKMETNRLRFSVGTVVRKADLAARLRGMMAKRQADLTHNVACCQLSIDENHKETRKLQDEMCKLEARQDQAAEYWGGLMARFG